MHFSLQQEREGRTGIRLIMKRNFTWEVKASWPCAMVCFEIFGDQITVKTLAYWVVS